MLRRLGGGLAVIGFLVLLGTAGGSDADLFGWDRLFLQLDISILLIVAGGISIYIDDVRQHSGRRGKKSPSLSLRESQPPLGKGAAGEGTRAERKAE